MAHVLEAAMEYGGEEKCVDVSLCFAALSSLFWLEYLFRNADDSRFDVARFLSWDFGLGTTFAALLAFLLSLAFRRE